MDYQACVPGYGPGLQPCHPGLAAGPLGIAGSGRPAALMQPLCAVPVAAAGFHPGRLAAGGMALIPQGLGYEGFQADEMFLDGKARHLKHGKPHDSSKATQQRYRWGRQELGLRTVSEAWGTAFLISGATHLDLIGVLGSILMPATVPTSITLATVSLCHGA